MTSFAQPAMPLGYDTGLPPEDEVDFSQLLEGIAMTADESLIWQQQSYSELGSPLAFLSPLPGSEWSKSSGRHSHQASNTGASSSLSPGTASLILTPTSTLLDYGGDVTLLEEPEASENTPTSPESGTSPSSDEYVHVDHLDGQSSGSRNMNIRPPPASVSGVTPSSLHQPGAHSSVSATSSTQRPWPSFSSASTSSTGGWMDPLSAGQWGHLEATAQGFGNTSVTTSQSFETDALSEFGALDNGTSRTFDNNLPFRAINEQGHTFAPGPFPSYYPFMVPSQPQQYQSTVTSTRGNVHPTQHHAVQQGFYVATAQPTPQRLMIPPTVPSQYGQVQPQGGAIMGRSLRGDYSATISASSSPTLTPGPVLRVGYHTPYPAVGQQQLRQRPSTQQPYHLDVPSHAHAAVARPSRQLQPAVAGPARPAHGHSAQADRRRGGRQRNTHLAHGTREKSSKMRKTGACWRCALQRDPCPDEGTPCNRCLISSQKGQIRFFECDRSKLPDFVYDFLPPSMTGMHQKQSIEDCVSERVVRFDKNNGIDVYLTSGYGPALKWRLYEFIPKGDELLFQLQYLQDPSSGTTMSKTKYSPPFGLLKLDTSADTYFDAYMNRLLHDDHLWEFGWTCFEEETQVDDFQARLLQLMCDFSMRTEDYDLRELLQKIIRMMIITYIMGHTLTISEDTLDAVLSSVQHSRRPVSVPTTHVSPRLANRQLKFFFCILRNQIYDNILNWQQQTLHSSGKKEATWLPAFCVMLGFAMVLEEVQRTICIQADAKAIKKEMTVELAEMEAFNACDRIDDRFRLLVGLYQCKYRDRKWSVKPGSFGNQTPELRDPVSRTFLTGVRSLLVEKREHLESRKDVPLGSENQCLYTSRLVARFLLPFLDLPT